jgi:hypothetical protein
VNTYDLSGAPLGKTVEQIAEARQLAAHRCRRMAQFLDMNAPLPIVRKEAELIARSLIDLGIISDADLGESVVSPPPLRLVETLPAEEASR